MGADAREACTCTCGRRLRSVSQPRLRVARVRDRGSNLCHEGLPLVLAEAQRPAFWVLGVSYRDLAAARLGDLYAVRPRVAVARPAPRVVTSSWSIALSPGSLALL